MADIAISYSHKNPDLAEQVRRAALARGFSVWMDEAEPEQDGMESIAIPWGQEHWDVITREFIRATVVIAIDTPEWRKSPYCRKELEFLEEWGKWVAFLPIGVSPSDPSRSYESFDEIESDLRGRRVVANAHARLADEVFTGRPRSARTKLESFFQTSRSRDARLMLAPDLSESGVSLPSKLAENVHRLVEQADAARRRLTRVTAGTLVVLMVLLVGSVAFWYLAEAGRKTAVRAANESRALALASESRSSESTLESVELAIQAVEHSNNSTTRSALSIARAQDARMRSVEIEKADYRGAALSADGTTLAVHTSTVITLLDSESGDVRGRFEVDDPISTGSLAVSEDGHMVFFISSRTGNVWSVSPGNDPRLVSATDAEELFTPDGVEVWWADTGGNLTKSAFGSDDRVSYRLPAPARAFHVEINTGTIDLVGSDGIVRSGYVKGAEFTQVSEFRIQSMESVRGRGTPGSTARVVRCSGHVHGYLRNRAIRGDVLFTIENNEIATRETGPATSFPPVCQDNGDAWFTTWVGGAATYTFEGSPRPVLPAGASRYVVASGTSNTDAIVVTNDGRLLRLRNVSTRETNGDAYVAVLPLQSGLFAIDSDSRVRRVSDGVVTGSIDGAIAPTSVATLKGVALLQSEAGLVRIDANGVPRVLLPIAGDNLRSVRTSSDGSQFVVSATNSVSLIDHTGRSRTITLPWLNRSDDSLTDADVSPDGTRLAVSTVRGVVAVLDLADVTQDPRVSDRTFPVGSGTHVAYSPTTGRLLVAPSDGVIVDLDDELRVVNSLYLGAAPRFLTTSADFALVTSDSGTATLIATSELEIVDTTADVYLDPRSVRFAPDTRSITGLSTFDTNLGGSESRVRVPLSPSN